MRLTPRPDCTASRFSFVDWRLARVCVRRSFTLLELLIVVTIMAAMMGMAFPALRGVREGNELRAAVRQLVALMKYARCEAVMGERTTEVFLDLEKREFWLDLREPDPKTGEYRPTRKKKKTQLEQTRALGRGMWFDEVTAYDSNIIKRDRLIAVDFFPDGSASPTLLTVAHPNGKKMTVEVMKSSGMTEVSPGTIEERQAAQGAPPMAPGGRY